ncbi:hypothetical protein JDV02_005537 [Purpureocillium takamizusanense]|uniref:Riboflavin kinase n=1 Tax=Purpureocillium takamizusanense TaxID=2060973 RepID=A0A9Q8QGP3_9HYPO|nr:uncharacterized protein JDV02_005537 [Purpureocillium takamizusanense]UNI19348.1 hypothetical protein JDV02_005537 [Purpureocillium takamizusanense]
MVGMEGEEDIIPRRGRRRRPSPSGDSYHAAPPPPPPPNARPGLLPLRPCRSAAQLRPGVAPLQERGRPGPLLSSSNRIRGGGGGGEVGFPIDDLPPPYSSFAPAGHDTNTNINGNTHANAHGGSGELQRAQSSSALSQAGHTTSNNTSPPLSVASISSPSLPPASQPSKASKWKTALGEAQYFAGGLVSHPAESTRHYSIIRHSHALVWYRGPCTSVTVTVLSDVPLLEEDKATAGSDNRRRRRRPSLWLQEKGYSGGLGMAVKALVGSTGRWIDVTPAREARPEHIPEADERAIQRDLRRFAKRASGRVKAHVPRETYVVRIPATATDGYFRLVLCAGGGGGGGGGEEGKEKHSAPKRVLCGSPIFRIASTSTDVAVVRGASLSTMPLEVGVKVASTIGQQVAKKYAGVAGAVVQNRAAKVAHYAAAKTAARTAVETYHKVPGLASSVSESWQRGRQERDNWQQQQQHLREPTVIAVIGPDAGPSAPFPVLFDGKVVASSRQSAAAEEPCYRHPPTATLKGVPDAIKTRLGGGVFAAWAMIAPMKGLDNAVDSDWHEAVVTIAPPRDATPSVAMRNSVAVHMAFDFDGATFYGATLKVLLMGYLRAASLPTGPSGGDGEQQRQKLAEEHAHDVMTTLASLGRDAWRRPRDTLAQMRSVARSERSFSDRLVAEATGRVQEQVDRIPLHWAGVRSESGTARDGMFGKGGLWIAR